MIIEAPRPHRERRDARAQHAVPLGLPVDGCAGTRVSYFFAAGF
jgi:hypothetical protein